LIRGRNRDPQEDLERIVAGFGLDVFTELFVRDIFIDEVDGVDAGIRHELSDFVDRFSGRLQEREERFSGSTDPVDIVGRPRGRQPRAPRPRSGERSGCADPRPRDSF
jgi:hypothetical protein